MGSFAQQIAESMPGPRVFIATCPIIDEEMAERIRKHKEARSHGSWHTIEETIDLVRALHNASEYRVSLIDCLTLWINNLIYDAGRNGEELMEEEIADHCQKLLGVCRLLPGIIIFVTNEVGMGIVPDNPVSRRYRDLVGRCNQIMAADADTVILLTCGLPIKLKERRLP